MSDSGEEDVMDESLSNADVMNKYVAATTIANKAIAKVVSELKAGATILSLCQAGDQLVEEEVKKVLKAQKAIDRGLAFPTCVSRNNIAGHISAEAEDKEVLEDGDVVKIDVGVHLDGFIGSAAHTHVVSSAAFPTTGRKADAICAAHVACEAALRLLKPGAKNKDITNVIKQVADAYHVTPVEGVLSHVMRRFVIDGEKVIINKVSGDQQVEEFEIAENDVYAIDIVMSTGEGKPKERERKPTIYKRSVDQSYMLKLQAARKVLTEIKSRFPALPFSIRHLEEKHVRFGLGELEKHGLVTSYPVLYERNGEFIAQFKFTVLIGSAGARRMTSHQLPYVSSEYNVEDAELKALLASPEPAFSKNAGKKKDKKKKAKTSGSEAPAAASVPAESSSTSTTTTSTATTAPTEPATPMDTN